MALFERFTVIPSIDLKAGQVVRLLRGEMSRATVYGSDPAEVARQFEKDGASLIHVVDLDGAVAGEPRNLEAIRAIRAALTSAKLDISGGIRSLASLKALLEGTEDCASLGSAAFLDPDLLRHACAQYPGRIFGSLDVRDGRLAIRGWVETTELTIAEAAARFHAADVAVVNYTDIASDGTEAGIDPEKFRAFAKQSRLPVVASGGVASLDDIRALARCFHDGVVGVISGRAIYEKRFSLPDALEAARAASS